MPAARRSPLRRRVLRAKVKHGSYPFVRRFKAWKTERAANLSYWLSNLDALELRVLVVLGKYGITGETIKWYFAFSKRLENRAMNFLEDTYFVEKDSLITEFVLRGLNEAILRECAVEVESLVYDKTGRVLVDPYYLFGHVISTLKVASGYRISGLVFDGTYLRYCDAGLNKIIAINADTGAWIKEIATPCGVSAGLAWQDAGHIWVGDTTTHVIYDLNPETGAINSQFNCGFDPGGIAYDGVDLWIGCEDDYDVRRFTLGGVLQETKTVPCSYYCHGLVWIDPYFIFLGSRTPAASLWEVDKNMLLRRHHTIPYAIGPYYGLCFDGKYLRVGYANNLWAPAESYISKHIKDRI